MSDVLDLAALVAKHTGETLDFARVINLSGEPGVGLNRKSRLRVRAAATSMRMVLNTAFPAPSRSRVERAHLKEAQMIMKLMAIFGLLCGAYALYLQNHDGRRAAPIIAPLLR